MTAAETQRVLQRLRGKVTRLEDLVAVSNNFINQLDKDNHPLRQQLQQLHALREHPTKRITVAARVLVLAENALRERLKEKEKDKAAAGGDEEIRAGREKELEDENCKLGEARNFLKTDPKTLSELRNQFRDAKEVEQQLAADHLYEASSFQTVIQAAHECKSDLLLVVDARAQTLQKLRIEVLALKERAAAMSRHAQPVDVPVRPELHVTTTPSKHSRPDSLSDNVIGPDVGHEEGSHGEHRLEKVLAGQADCHEGDEHCHEEVPPAQGDSNEGDEGLQGNQEVLQAAEAAGLATGEATAATATTTITTAATTTTTTTTTTTESNDLVTRSSDDQEEQQSEESKGTETEAETEAAKVAATLRPKKVIEGTEKANAKRNLLFEGPRSRQTRKSMIVYKEWMDTQAPLKDRPSVTLEAAERRKGAKAFVNRYLAVDQTPKLRDSVICLMGREKVASLRGRFEKWNTTLDLHEAGSAAPQSAPALTRGLLTRQQRLKREQGFVETVLTPTGKTLTIDRDRAVLAALAFKAAGGGYRGTATRVQTSNPKVLSVSLGCSAENSPSPPSTPSLSTSSSTPSLGRSVTISRGGSKRSPSSPKGARRRSSRGSKKSPKGKRLKRKGGSSRSRSKSRSKTSTPRQSARVGKAAPPALGAFFSSPRIRTTGNPLSSPTPRTPGTPRTPIRTPSTLFAALTPKQTLREMPRRASAVTPRRAERERPAPPSPVPTEALMRKASDAYARMLGTKRGSKVYRRDSATNKAPDGKLSFGGA